MLPLPLRFAAFVSLIGAGAAQAAPVLEKRYIVRDGGQVRAFETASSPTLSLTLTGGAGTITFPSVPGTAYVMHISGDLVNWTNVTVTATARVTTWTDPAASIRRYYSVKKP